MSAIKFMTRALFAVVAMASAASAQAAVITIPLTGPVTTFTRTPGAGNFLDTFLFNIPGRSRITIRLYSIMDRGPVTNINFNTTNVKFNNVRLGLVSRGVVEDRLLSDLDVAKGLSRLVVQGSAGARGFYTGTLTVAVPEPAMWALMIIGFGAGGVALRFRRRPAAAIA